MQGGGRGGGEGEWRKERGTGAGQEQGRLYMVQCQAGSLSAGHSGHRACDPLPRAVARCGGILQACKSTWKVLENPRKKQRPRESATSALPLGHRQHRLERFLGCRNSGGGSLGCLSSCPRQGVCTSPMGTAPQHPTKKETKDLKANPTDPTDTLEPQTYPEEPQGNGEGEYSPITARH